MTTPLSLKLVQGAASLDLSSAPYKVAADCVPPATFIQSLIASGTSANRYSGGDVMSKSGANTTWTFGLHIYGNSEAQIRAAVRQVQYFLDQSGPANPVIAALRTNTDTVLEPLWGQYGAAIRYEIVSGIVTLSPSFSHSDLRARGLPNCTLTLQIKPFPKGQPQLAMTATGGILPNQWGTADGSERGLIIPPSTGTGGNKIPNPVFGNATWSTNWSAFNGASISQNTNSTYLLPQTQSSMLVQCAAAGQALMTLNVGNTSTYVLQALVRRPDLGAVSVTDAAMYYSSAQSTTYRNLGNGLWLMYCSVTGINAGTLTGVAVAAGRSLYVLYVGMAVNALPGDIIWGDLLGCAWAGTAHNSASTRTAASSKLAIDDTILRASQGSIVLTWIAPVGQGGYAAANYILWDTRDAGHLNYLVFYYNGTTQKFEVDYSGGSAQTAVQTFSAGDVITFHVTWGPANGLTIYKNGASAATGTSYTPNVFGANLCLGSQYDATLQISGTFSGLRTYGYELSATEVANDYANISQATGATQDVARSAGAIPWFWTNAGDNVMGAVNGLVNSVQKYNWAVVGGIPGSYPALVDFKLTMATRADTVGSLWLSRILLPYFYSPLKMFWSEQQGNTDVNHSSGDAFAYNSIIAATWRNAGTLYFDQIGYQLFQGHEFTLFTHLADAGTNLQVSVGYFVGTVAVGFRSKARSLAADATMRLFQSVPAILPPLRHTWHDDTPLINAGVEMDLWRYPSGATNNVSVDFFTLLPRPLTQINFNSTSSDGKIVLVKGRAAGVVTTTTPSYNSPAQVLGEQFELEPGGLNIIQTLIGGENLDYDVNGSFTVNYLYVTPRYQLI